MPGFIIEKSKVVSRSLKLTSAHKGKNLKSTHRWGNHEPFNAWIEGRVYRQMRCGAKIGHLPEDGKLVSISLISKQRNFDLTSGHSPRQRDGHPVSPACTGEGKELGSRMPGTLDPRLRFRPLSLSARPPCVRQSTGQSTSPSRPPGETRTGQRLPPDLHCPAKGPLTMCGCFRLNPN